MRGTGVGPAGNASERIARGTESGRILEGVSRESGESPHGVEAEFEKQLFTSRSQRLPCVERTDTMPTEHDDAGDGSESTPLTSRRTVLAGAAGALAVGGLGVGSGFARSGDDDGMSGKTTFTVRIENVSKQNTLETGATGDASKQTVPVSPGAYAVHAEPGALFAAGEPDRGEGLESIAEDGDPSMLAESLPGDGDVTASGAFTTPVDAMEPAPIGPGGAYEFSFEATPGDRLSFAAMFVPSNDLFFAPDDRGLALFDGDEPLSGDVTAAIDLWDAGTEANEEPGVGQNQAQRQPEAGAGTMTDEPVRLVTAVADGYDYPYVPEVLRASLHPETDSM